MNNMHVPLTQGFHRWQPENFNRPITQSVWSGRRVKQPAWVTAFGILLGFVASIAIGTGLAILLLAYIL